LTTFQSGDFGEATSTLCTLELCRKRRARIFDRRVWKSNAAIQLSSAPWILDFEDNMPTLVKHGARELSFAEEFETISQVKAALARAHGIAPESARLVAKGKTLSDEESVPDCKMMLFIRGGTSTLSLSLRCLVSGRVVKQVQVASSMRVSELAERATVALGLSGHRALYLEAGKQLMRPELSLNDYTVTNGTEIFVCPVSRTAEELGAEAEPKLLPLPLLPPSIKSAVPKALEPVPPTPPAQNADGECSQAGARAPARMRTGVLGEAGAAAQVQMIPIPIEVLRELQRSECGGGKPIDERALLGLIDQQMHATLGTLGILGELPRIEQQQARQEEHLELVCSKLVHGLQRAQPAEQLGNKPSDAKERRKESAAWGKGLSKGFLSRPKKQKRQPAQPPAPVVVVSQAENAELSAAVCAANRAKKRAAACCLVCAARLPVTASIQARCRCGELFCAAHMHTHACKHDYKAAFANHLRAANPKVEPTKLETL
jgi:hypothetical protein